MVTVFNNEFDALAQELETITDMMALSKKEIEKFVKEELKKSEQEIIKQVKQLIKSSSKETTLTAEKNLTRQEESLKTYIDQ